VLSCPDRVRPTGSVRSNGVSLPPTDRVRPEADDQASPKEPFNEIEPAFKDALRARDQRGPAGVSRNAYKGGTRVLLREIAHLLRLNDPVRVDDAKSSLRLCRAITIPT